MFTLDEKINYEVYMLLEIVVFSILFFIILACIETESFILSILPMIISITLVHYWVKINLISLILSNIPITIASVCAYIMVGVIWSLIRYYMFIRKKYIAEDDKKLIESYYITNNYSIYSCKYQVMGWMAW